MPEPTNVTPRGGTACEPPHAVERCSSVTPVRSDRTYAFEQPPGAVWDAIARVESYQCWWPWLRRFDAVALRQGERWTCTIRPPLPYVLRFSVTLDEVRPDHLIAATVSGDLGGEAVVSLAPKEDGCVVRLRSSLRPQGQLLRGVAALAPRVARFGHDWVLDTGLRQFRHRAL